MASSIDRVEWIRRFYKLLDEDITTNNLQLAKDYFDEESMFRLANNPEVIGRTNFFEFLKKLTDFFEGTEHTFANIHIVHADLVIVEGFARYKLHGGKMADFFPFCTIVEFRERSNFVKHFKAFACQTPSFVQSGFDFTADEEGKMVMKKRVIV